MMQFGRFVSQTFSKINSNVLIPSVFKNPVLTTSKYNYYYYFRTTTSMSKFSYPEVRRDENSNYEKFGTKVEDPYRWLEDAASDETKKFVDGQNEVTVPFINSCPHRQSVISRLKDLFEYPRYGAPFKRGSNYFMYMNTGLQNQSVLYIMRGSIDANAEVFLDPNKLSKDGTVSLSAYTNQFSHDGELFAYGLSKSGSDWTNVKIKQVETGEDLDDEISKVKFSTIAWTHDNRGFFYSCYPNHDDKCDGTETVEYIFQKMYYHRVGTPQSADILVYERTDEPHFRFNPEISECGRYLHIYSIKGCEYNLWHFYRFDDPLNPVIEGYLPMEPVVTEYNADYFYIANDGPIQYFRTNRNAPNYRIISVNLTDPICRMEKNWTNLVKDDPKDVLESAVPVCKDVLVCCYIRDVISIVQLRKIADGSLIRELKLPVGTVSSINCKRTQDEIFFDFTSFLVPGIIYHLKTDTELKAEPEIFKEVKPNNFDANNFVTKQDFYESKDGTRVPIFLVHHKDLVQDGTRPCLLYAYGGFNISMKPVFDISQLILMDNLNGVFAMANIRGGGEYGEKWHHGGHLFNKQKCFDDFIAAGEYLAQEKYTSNDKLIIQGGSNGGLLIGAVINQRPDLFGCALAHVGVMDLIRYHKFTIGHAWMSEYGSPDEEEHFNNLIRLSPVHNVPNANKTNRFPATLLLTADHDDRVVPLHSFKYIAQLQYKLANAVPETPLMIRIDTNAGHGQGMPTEKMIEEMADYYSFVINSLSLEYK